MKTLFIVVFFTLVGIFLAYFLMKTPSENEPIIQEPTSELPETADQLTESNEEERVVSESEEVTAQAEDNAVIVEEPIVISVDSLGEGQKQLLETLGVDTNNIEITPTMIACSEEKIGKTRLDEIIAGATPGFFEGVSLVSCYNE